MDLTGRGLMIVVGILFSILILAFLLFGTKGFIDRSSGIASSKGMPTETSPSGDYLLSSLIVLPFLPLRRRKGFVFDITTVIILIAIILAIMLSIWFSFSSDFGKIGSDVITQVTTPFT